MRPQPDGMANHKPADRSPATAEGSRLVHLRLSARVVQCQDEVRLVGNGVGVEISTDRATRIRVDNELITLSLHGVVDESPIHAQTLLRRWRALSERVRVRVLIVRTGEGSSSTGRQVELVGPDGAVLLWHEPSPVELERQASSGPPEVHLPK